MTVSRPDTTPTPVEGLSIERWAAASGSERGSRASLIIHGGGHRWRAHAEGNGAVDALMRAVDVALAPLLGDGISLATYDVHASAPGPEATPSCSTPVGERTGAIQAGT